MAITEAILRRNGFQEVCRSGGRTYYRDRRGRSAIMTIDADGKPKIERLDQ